MYDLKNKKYYLKKIKLFLSNSFIEISSYEADSYFTFVVYVSFKVVSQEQLSCLLVS